MRKKILFLMSCMHAGGAERVASILSNAWVSHGDEVILAITVFNRGECFYPLLPGVRLIYIADLVGNKDRTWLNSLNRLYAVRRLIIKEHPDVIVSFLHFVNVATVIASIGLKIPTIICERNDPFAMSIPWWERFQCRLTYPLADALMVQTQALATQYASSGLTLRRLRIIPNPISEHMMNIQHQTNDKAIKRLLGVGRLWDQKQFCVLIKIFASLAKRYADWSLRIVGQGYLHAALQKQIIDLGLEKRIELVGQKENIEKELAEADAFVLTSKHEGFPNVLLEAMAAGLPCVTFDCPSGPREISMDGQMALLVPLNDEHSLGVALERIMSDAGLRESLGKRAKSSVIERYALDKILEQWNSLFREVGVKF